MAPEKSKRRLFLASRNAHKLKELQALVGDAWDIGLATDLDPGIGWDETGSTFADNARIKALALKAHTSAAVLADDSGLSVDALGGAPGVYSSRYAGRDGDDEANNQKLLAELAATEDAKRTARFVCCLIFIDEAGREYEYTGTCEGTIARSPRGKHGFGYDPLFLVEGLEKTMAELTEAEKNSISHRSRAVAKWTSQWS